MKIFPFESKLLIPALESERIFLYGSDKEKNPWFYFKPFSEPGKYFKRKNIKIKMEDYLNYIVYVFEFWSELLINKGLNTTFTMLVDWNGEEIDSETSNFYFDSIWNLINTHYPLKLVRIHLANVKLKSTHLISKLKKKKIIFHDELYKISLLSYFNQNELHHEYGGSSLREYDITKLKETNDLAGFITT